MFADEKARITIVQTEGHKGDARTYGVNSTDRRIHTVRSIEELNRLSRAGVRLLIKPVTYSDQIGDQASLKRNRATGELKVFNLGRRLSPEDLDAWETLIPQYRYRSSYPDGPLAAYVIPSDLRIGERVTLEDVIDDLVLMGSEYTEGAGLRREMAAAIWTGSDFAIQPASGGYMRSLG